MWTYAGRRATESVALLLHEGLWLALPDVDMSAMAYYCKLMLWGICKPATSGNLTVPHCQAATIERHSCGSSLAKFQTDP